MRCYHIANGKVSRGIPASLLPSTDGMPVTGEILEADVELIGSNRLSLSLEDLTDMPLHRLSSVCSLRLVPHTRQDTAFVLAVYSPREIYLDRDGGDESEIVYRDPEVFALLAKPGHTRLQFTRTEGTIGCNEHGLYIDCNAPSIRKKPDAFIIRVR